MLSKDTIFTLLLPVSEVKLKGAGKNEIIVKAYAVGKAKHGVFVEELCRERTITFGQKRIYCLDELSAYIAQRIFGEKAAEKVRQSATAKELADLKLGEDVLEVYLPSYLEILTCIKNFLNEMRQRCPLYNSIYDPILLALKISIRRLQAEDQVDYMLAFVMGYPDRGFSPPPIQEEQENLPVAICDRYAGEQGIAIFIGVSLKEGVQLPYGEGCWAIRCPLVQIYRTIVGKSKNKYQRTISILHRICKRIEQCHKKQLSDSDIAKNGIIATNVMTYFLRSKPNPYIVTSLDVEPITGISLESFTSPIESITLYRGDIILAISTINILLPKLKLSLLYPLPVRLKATYYSTYYLNIKFNQQYLTDLSNKYKEEILHAQPTNNTFRSLFAKMVLACAGFLDKQKWETIVSNLRSSSDSIRRAALQKLAKRAVYSIKSVMRGESYVLSLSGLYRGIEFLVRLAIEDSSGYLNKAYQLMDEAINSNEFMNLMREYIEYVLRFTLAHILAYATTVATGLTEGIVLYVRFNEPLLVEARQGGFGHLLGLSPNYLAESLKITSRLGDEAWQRIVDARRRQYKSTYELQTNYAVESHVLEILALKVAMTYGVTRPPASKIQDVVYTYLPAWLIRGVLTYDKLTGYVKEFGISNNVAMDSLTWSNLMPELLPSYFDIDFIDANTYHIAGIDSWAGDLEKHIFNMYELAKPAIVDLIGSLEGKRIDNRNYRS